MVNNTTPGDRNANDDDHLHDGHTGQQWQQLNSQQRVYLMSEFCKFSLPYTNPGDQQAEWIRVNGSRQIVVHPRTVVENGKVTHLWAYGKIARLLLIWICTQVQRQKKTNTTRTIMLPSTLRQLMGEMGIHRKPAKADYERFRQQIRAIVSFHAEITDTRVLGDTVIEDTPPKLDLVERAEIRWDRARRSKGTVQEGSYITLTEQTWARMCKSRPLDRDMVEALTISGKGQDLDVYCWLSQRIHDLNGSPRFTTPTITWRQLAAQFGATYTRLGNFTTAFKHSLSHVAMLWPQLRYRIVDGKGLSLMRSETTVKPVGSSPRPPRKQHATHANAAPTISPQTMPEARRIPQPTTDDGWERATDVPEDDFDMTIHL